MKPAGRHNLLYYCEICRPKFANGSVVASIDLSSIEHHMRCNKGFEVIKGLEYEYKEPDRHKAEILARLEGWLK
jgi:hypothetical protein